MARHLSAADIGVIANWIRSMEAHSLTWESICDQVAPLVGKRPTRQSLCKHPAVIAAYKFSKRKDHLPEPAPSKPASLTIAAQRIRRLEMEVEELKKINHRLLEQFLIIQYNAYLHGMKEEQFFKPLPPIDRERTDQH